MLRRTKRSGLWDAAIVCGLVALAGVAACLLRTVFGPVGCVMILLAPVVVAGTLYGVRTSLLAAGLAYLAYAFLFPEPLVPSKLGVTGRNLTLPGFILAALIAGGFARGFQAWRRRSTASPPTTRAVIEATAFFNVTPNADAIRLKLAETVSAMTLTATAVTDRHGRLRAGAGSNWHGAVDELEELADALIRQPRDHIVTRGDFRARLIRTAGQVQGVIIWRRPPRDRARSDAADEHVELLAELAAAAIARSGRDHPVQMGSSVS